MLQINLLLHKPMQCKVCDVLGDFVHHERIRGCKVTITYGNDIVWGGGGGPLTKMHCVQ